MSNECELWPTHNWNVLGPYTTFKTDLFTFAFLYAYGCLPACMYVHHTSVWCQQRGCWIPLNKSYRSLWATMCTRNQIWVPWENSDLQLSPFSDPQARTLLLKVARRGTLQGISPALKHPFPLSKKVYLFLVSFLTVDKNPVNFSRLEISRSFWYFYNIQWSKQFVCARKPFKSWVSATSFIWVQTFNKQAIQTSCHFLNKN